MTTVLGLIYKDGVMLFADMAETLEGDSRVVATKLDFVTKLHFLTKNYAVGCAGKSSSVINAFVNHLHDYFNSENELMTSKDLYKKLNEEVIPAFCEKDRKIAAKIYGRDQVRPIDIEALFAARLQDNQYALYKIMIKIFAESLSYDDVGVKEIPFGGIGTGGVVVEPLMSQALTFITKRDYHFKKWSLKMSALFCTIMLTIARDTDTKTGRRTSGLVVRENDPRTLHWSDYMTASNTIPFQLLVQALEEMPNFMRELPFKKILSLARPFMSSIRLSLSSDSD